MTARLMLILGLITVLLTASPLANPASFESDDSSYGGRIAKWRAERLEEVNGENGWTTLVGLFWLKEGKNTIGSSPSNDIVLPKDRAPKFAAVMLLDNGIVHLESRRGADIMKDGKVVSKLVLDSDADGKPTMLKLGSLIFFVIKRGERLGLRVKDRKNPARSRFAGLDYYPVDLKWKIEAKYEPYDPVKLLPIANVLGMVEDMESPGALVFQLDGKTLRLDPVLEKGSKQLFIIFADQTSGKETYGAGRYLYADPPGADGKVIVDFNKAYNPPCAFTKFATCPLPPKQNRLPMRVHAGEKKYAGAEH